MTSVNGFMYGSCLPILINRYPTGIPGQRSNQGKRATNIVNNFNCIKKDIKSNTPTLGH